MVAHFLDEGTETEGEDTEVQCQANLVGHVRRGQLHTLSLAPCNNVAERDAVTILVEDRAASDLADGVTAHLCGHHARLYRTERYAQKCARRECYHAHVGERDGVIYCAQHLAGGTTHRATARAKRWGGR